MPDIVTLLQQEHRKVEELFTQFEQTGDLALAETIIHELSVHTRVEEAVVYEPLRQEVSAEKAEHAEEEHREADGIMEQILSADEDQVPQLMTQLKEAVLHHVKEEEGSVLPEMAQKLGGERMEELGRRFEQAKADDLADEAALETEGATKDELYEQAQQMDIEGRSDMTKDELADAIQRQQ